MLSNYLLRLKVNYKAHAFFAAKGEVSPSLKVKISCPASVIKMMCSH